MKDDAPRIRALPADVVARIAAGEVVQRAASAVKELLENALDAGASAVDVWLDPPGCAADGRSFSVVDNGAGIARADMGMLARRHCTSKIASAAELAAGVATFGFRGEALAALAAVARLEVTTRTASDLVTGWRASYADGRMLSEPVPVAAPRGTAVLARDLFHNAPVRRDAALRAGGREEYGAVLAVVVRYAAALHGRVAFSCRRGSSPPDVCTSLRTSGGTSHGQGDKLENDQISAQANTIPSYSVPYGLYTGDPVGAARALFQRTGAMVCVSATHSARPLALSGAVSVAQGASRGVPFVLFANGRLVECPAVRRAVVAAAAASGGTRGGVFGLLLLSVRPGDVDANVHPSKRTVVFSGHDDVVAWIGSCVADALRSAATVPSVGFPAGARPSLTQSRICNAGTFIPDATHSDSKPLGGMTQSPDGESRHDNFLATQGTTSIPYSTSQRRQGVSQQPSHAVRTDHTARTLDAFLAHGQAARSADAPRGDAPRGDARAHEKRALGPADAVAQRGVLVGALDARTAFVQVDAALVSVDYADLLRASLHIAVRDCLGGVFPAFLLAEEDVLASLVDDLRAGHWGPPESLPAPPADVAAEVLACCAERPGDVCAATGALFGVSAVCMPASFSPGAAPRIAARLAYLFAVEWDAAPGAPAIAAAIADAWLAAAQNPAMAAAGALEAAGRVSRGCAAALECGPPVLLATTHQLYRVFERC